MVMMAIASVIASAVGYFSMKALLDSIWTFHAGVGWVPPVVATLMILVIAVATVGH